jgi:putative transcriptional regulator
MLGEKDTTVAGAVRIFAGGPVQPELGFVIHSTDYREPGTIDINARVALTANREVLRDIGNAKGPKQSLIAFGYAGWGPGQLEGELARRDWAIAPGESRLIFDADRDKGLGDRLLTADAGPLGATASLPTPRWPSKASQRAKTPHRYSLSTSRA